MTVKMNSNNARRVLYAQTLGELRGALQLTSPQLGKLLRVGSVRMWRAEHREMNSFLTQAEHARLVMRVAKAGHIDGREYAVGDPGGLVTWLEFLAGRVNPRLLEAMGKNWNGMVYEYLAKRAKL